MQDGEQSRTKSACPILRWAGSKRKLVPELIKHIPKSFGRYIEPFVGSGCLFFALRPARAVLGDINRDLIEAYATVRSHPILVHRLLMSIPGDSAHYYELRDSDMLTHDPIARAARFIYLNRHCFNGVFRTNRAGKFNVPYGSRLGTIPDQTQFLRCARALRSADLIGQDFESVISHADRGDFVYLDPPYAKRGARQRGEYGYTSFGVPDLMRLERVLVELDGKGAIFLLSYESCREVDGIRQQWSSRKIRVKRHIAGFHEDRDTVSELLVSNLKLDS